MPTSSLDLSYSLSSIGDWSTDPLPTWSFIDARVPSLGVQYSMTSTESCYATTPPTPYTANVIVSPYATRCRDAE
jgi:hypothetical protein